MQVGPCIPVGVQLQKAEIDPTSGPTWRLSHLGARVRQLRHDGARRGVAGDRDGEADLGLVGHRGRVHLDVITRPLAPPHSLDTVLLKVEPYNGVHLDVEARRRDTLDPRRRRRLDETGDERRGQRVGLISHRETFSTTLQPAYSSTIG